MFWISKKKEDKKEDKKDEKKEEKISETRRKAAQAQNQPKPLVATTPTPKPTNPSAPLDLRAEKQLMKKKYANVAKISTIEDDEEFEVVEKARPAHPKLFGKNKLRWKEDQPDESIASVKDDEFEDRKSSKKNKKKKDEDFEKISKDPAKTLTAVEIGLLKKIEILEMENTALKKKLIEVQDQVKMMTRAQEPNSREDAVEEPCQAESEPNVQPVKASPSPPRSLPIPLSASSASSGSTVTATSRSISSAKSSNDREVTKKMAREMLAIMRRNQVLERALPTRDNVVLLNFFRECIPPNEKISNLLELAISKGLDAVTTNSTIFDDVVSVEMRNFIRNSNESIKTMTAMILQCPEFIPDAWGGGLALTKLRSERVVPTDGSDSSPKQKAGSTTAAQPQVAPSAEKDDFNRGRRVLKSKAPDYSPESPWTEMAEKALSESKRAMVRRIGILGRL
ncbi:unnamed protein product [Caenorhabditis auriculariae]|uniref:DUF7774 domain-containing protein n=1 Tax=Caenorhabditis auriculariae TaxID=2777116 RepID=A0A8S1GP81_9PELO|nr:unnamed protein product [Caenorhabditis auriculariae]